MYKIKTDGGLRGNFIIKNIENNNLTDILCLIVDIDYIEVKSFKDKSGYDLIIVQKDIEASDIIEYFIDRFKKKYIINGVSKCRFIFRSYNKVKNLKDESVSGVTFSYKFNLFEKREIVYDKSLDTKYLLY